MKKTHALFAFVGLIVLLTAGAAQSLSGTNTVDSGDIIDGQVKFADIKPDAVTQSRIRTNGVASSEVKDNSLTGTDVNESTLVLTCPAGTTQAGDTCYGPEKAPASFQGGMAVCHSKGMHYPTLSAGTFLTTLAPGSDVIWTDDAFRDGVGFNFAIHTAGGIGYDYSDISTLLPYRCVIGLGARLPVGVIASEDDNDAADDVQGAPPAN
jgi:hypothetical protein